MARPWCPATWFYWHPALPCLQIAASMSRSVDQAALTGESLPVTLYEGDKTLMGSTVVRGETEGTVEFTGVDTFFGKTAALLANTEELSNVQLLLISIIRNLTILSLVMCAVVLAYVMTIVPFME